MENVIRFAEAGGFVFGVCNGFQILCEAGLLPGTLLHNDHQKFSCKNIYIKPDNDNTNVTSLLNKDTAYKIPIAHGEGTFVTRDAGVLERIRAADQVAVRYDGDNPSGSVDDIAGICDPTGRILGLMPHPERFVDVTHHPTWTRGGVERPDGLVFFRKAAEYFN